MLFQPPEIEPSWLPHTLGGWLATVVVLFGISGAGSVAAVWRFLLQPVYRQITDEHRERKHEYELLTHNEYGVLSRHRAQLKGDIDNVGMKYNELEKASTDREARVRELEGRMRDSEHDRGTLHKDVGALTADVASFREQQNQMRVDVIAHIQAAKKETLAAIEKLGDRVGDVERKVAVIDDRQRRDGGETT